MTIVISDMRRVARLAALLSLAVGLAAPLSGARAEGNSASGDLDLSEIEVLASEAYDAGELNEAILFWRSAANRSNLTCRRKRCRFTTTSTTLPTPAS